jgi:hypothetical protein
MVIGWPPWEAALSNNRVALEGLLDPDHELLCLARTIDWQAGPTLDRKWLGLALLRILYRLHDEDLCRQWAENPYFQAFCGMTHFSWHCDVSPQHLYRWRTEIGDDALQAWISRVLPQSRQPPARFVIDVDGVVAMLTPDNDYRRARPIPEIIAAINRLYADGHHIIMLTARGSATGLSWRHVTEEQFATWGLKYHELHFGKPAADYYVDDRLVTVETLYAMASGQAFPPSSRAPCIGD